SSIRRLSWHESSPSCHLYRFASGRWHLPYLRSAGTVRGKVYILPIHRPARPMIIRTVCNDGARHPAFNVDRIDIAFAFLVSIENDLLPIGRPLRRASPLV